MIITSLDKWKCFILILAVFKCVNILLKTSVKIWKWASDPMPIICWNQCLYCWCNRLKDDITFSAVRKVISSSHMVAHMPWNGHAFWGVTTGSIWGLVLFQRVHENLRSLLYLLKLPSKVSKTCGGMGPHSHCNPTYNTKCPCSKFSKIGLTKQGISQNTNWNMKIKPNAFDYWAYSSLP